LRQALFNSLQIHIAEARVLDLFAGSGALGLESLSRGASNVVMVEDSRAATKLIEVNARDLGVHSQITLLADSVERAHQELVRLAPFDIILADPPYAGGWEMKLLNDLPWASLLADGGHFCLEWGTQKSKVETLPDEVFHGEVFQLVKVREKNYGDSVLTTYQKK
jgi:16S rRNA (guanine966-N2)-methyltransferase